MSYDPRLERVHHTKTGASMRPTGFGFACGAVEKKGIDGSRAMLSFENGCYHVKGFRLGEHFAESFRLLSVARRFYDLLNVGS